MMPWVPWAIVLGVIGIAGAFWIFVDWKDTHR